jgi:hypothetical protein
MMPITHDGYPYTGDNYYVLDMSKLIQIFAHVKASHCDLMLNLRLKETTQQCKNQRTPESFNKGIGPATFF